MDCTQATIDGQDLILRPAVPAHFSLTGFAWYGQQPRYWRLPEHVLPHVNEGARNLASHTAGGMLRFRTDSGTIALDVQLSGEGNHPPGMTRCSVSGFDLYEGAGVTKSFFANARPELGQTDYQSILCRNRPRQMTEWTLYFPLRNGVNRLLIGLDPDAAIEPPAAFTHERPILFYGSSITHGACASRPGLAYPPMVCRRLDANMINLGFAGSAKGEPALAEAIGTLDLSAFVLDYDHNAPSLDYLEKTHEPFFQLVRKAQPELPCVMVSRPGFWDDMAAQRRDAIRRTYERAVAAGDRNVYFVDGETLFGTTERDACTTQDKVHPNDIGFLRMADAITPAVRQALGCSS